MACANPVIICCGGRATVSGSALTASWTLDPHRLLAIWLLAVGRQVETRHLVDLVDRHDRRDLSIFRWGWDFIERCLALSDPLPIIAPSNLCLVSGS
ncbi:MAG: hypothetical protein H0X30_03660 [Anaerolineae bacterium]|nr:hypothetical protein [Anaerolineae bacterium]